MFKIYRDIINHIDDDDIKVVSGFEEEGGFLGKRLLTPLQEIELM